MKNNGENLLMVNYDIVQNNYYWMFSRFNKIEDLINKVNSMDKFDKLIFDEARESMIELIKFKEEFLSNGLEKSLKSNVIQNRQVLDSEFNFENSVREFIDR